MESSITLRPHQSAAVDAIRQAFREGKRAPLFVAPTGSGKTVLFSYIAQNAVRKGHSVLILAHRGELLDQISDTLSRFGVDHGFIAAGRPVADRLTQVASVQTLARRDPRAFDLVIVDEAHHATARNALGKILSAHAGARLLGVTATPARLSGEGLGDLFDTLLLGPTVSELTALGLLAPARVFAPAAPDLSGVAVRAGDFVQAQSAAVMNKASVTGDVIDHYQRLAPGRPFVGFCVSIQHATDTAAQFRAAGIHAVEVHGRMDAATRRSIIEDFRRGRLLGLLSVDLISEGFDVPGIHCGISLRPTASLGLWPQQIGRCLRIAPGKTDAIILDHAGNALRHGLPTDEQPWTLEGRAKGKRGPNAVQLRICPNCFAAMSIRVQACRECGHAVEVKSRPLLELDGELTEITAKRDRAAEQARARGLAELVAVAKSRGYRRPLLWAKHVLAGRQAKGN